MSDDYAARLGRALYWADTDLKRRIVAEIAAHRSEAATAGMKRSDEPPGVVAKRYLQIYGFGIAFTALCALAGAAFGFLSAVQADISWLDGLQLLSLLAALLLTAWCGIAGGMRSGLAVGCAAAVARLVAMAVGVLVQGYAVEALSLALFVASCAMVPLIGFLGGEARKRWGEE
ncbi:MAG: hypothetical protein HZB92_06295 [Euryarchaeota archaeon]|nr:hypothetical protein [Euryarchaeota archaeon]